MQRHAARDVANIYPVIKQEVAEALGLSVDFRPTIVLDMGKRTIRSKTGGDNYVGYAVPEQNLIMLDTPRVYTRPLTLKTVLRHELCHLTLHSHIEKLPWWLDEGVCQWVSDGLPDVLLDGGGRSLQEALMAGTLIPLSALDEFPHHSIRLAYEESKSIIEFMEGKFGKKILSEVLRHLKEGSSIDEAIQESFFMPKAELEKKWRADIEGNLLYLRYFSLYLYEILFFIAAIITICGFVIVMGRRKTYAANEADDDNETLPPE